MKKRKFMGFLAMLSCATLLAGCELPGPLQTAVDWANDKIVSPIKNLIPGSQKEEKEDTTPEDQKFAVSFEANGGSGSMASVADVKGEYTLPACSFTAPEGKEFAGWKVNGSGDLLQPGAKISVSANVSLVAQWKEGSPAEEKFAVSFDANGGSGSMAVIADVEGEYELPACGFTAPEGKEFAGWKVNGEGELLQSGAKISVSANVSLVAQWEMLPVIHISESLPTRAYTGDSIDMKQYVTVDYADSFSVVLDKESTSIASVSEDNVITITGEGTVSFTIQAGGVSSASLSVGAYSHVRENLYYLLAEVGNQYTVRDLQWYEPESSGGEEEEPEVPEPPVDVGERALLRDVEEEPGEGEGEGGEEETAGWKLADIIIHGENYLESYAMGGGLLRFGADDSDAYFFEFIEEEPYVAVDQDLYSVAVLEQYNDVFSKGFNPLSSSAVYGYNSEIGEYLEISGTNARYFAMNSLFAPSGYIYEGENAVGYYSRIDFAFANYGTAEAPMYVAEAYCYAKIQTGLFSYEEQLNDIALIMVGDLHQSDSDLDAYCVAGNKPALPDNYHDFIYEGMTASDFLLGPDSAWMGSSGKITVSYGWVDDYGYALDPAEVEHGDTFAVGEDVYFTSQNSIYKVEEDSEHKGEYLALEGKASYQDKIYDVYFDEGAVIAAEEDAVLTSVWDASYVFPGLQKAETFPAGSLNSVKHSSVERIHAPEPVEPQEQRLAHRDAEPVTSHSFADIVAAYAEAGIEVIIPDYEGANIEFDDTYYPYTGFYSIYGSDATEMASFVSALQKAGWEMGPDEEETFDYCGYFGTTDAYIGVADWSEDDWGIIIYFYIPSLQLDSFPVDKVDDFILEREAIYSTVYADVVDYTVADPEGYFEYDLYEGAYYDYADVYVYGSTALEMSTYKDQLVEAGWVVVAENDGDYTLQFAETYTFVDLISNLDDEDDPYINVSFYVITKAHQAEVNSWRAHEFFSALYSGSDAIALVGDYVDLYYAYTGENMEDYFDSHIYVDECGLVQITLEFGWDDGVNYQVLITEEYDASIADKCAEFDLAVAEYFEAQQAE